MKSLYNKITKIFVVFIIIVIITSYVTPTFAAVKSSKISSILQLLEEKIKSKTDGNSTKKVTIPGSPGPGYNFSYNNLNTKLQKVYRYLYSKKSDMIDCNQIELVGLKNTVGSLTKSEINKVFMALIEDKPEFHYICTRKIGSNIRIYNWSITSNYIKFTFKDKKMREELASINSTANTVIKNAKRQTSTYQKIKYVHDWLCNNLTYKVNGAGIEGFILKKGQCFTYSQMFQYIMNQLDIDCIHIEGLARNSRLYGSHTWNQVYVNGQWYLIDVCWDDPETGFHYKYFLRGQDELNNRIINNKYPKLARYGVFD